MNKYWRTGEVFYNSLEDAEKSGCSQVFNPEDDSMDYAMIYHHMYGWSIWRSSNTHMPGIYPVKRDTARDWMYCNGYLDLKCVNINVNLNQTLSEGFSDGICESY